MNEHDSSSLGLPKSTPRELDQTLVEIENLAQQLDELKKELVWSNRLTTLGTMSAVLAHEYNNLLTPILSYAQLALANPDDRDLNHKALQVAVECVRKAQQIANATLGFARPEDAEKPENTTLSRCIEDSLIYVGPALEHDGVQLQLEIPDCTLTIDPLKLQQVLVNLMDNARKAMAGQPAPRRLRVSAWREQGGFLIQVADTGPGFAEELRGKAFDAFITQPSTPNSMSGTGLGLRICKDLITSAGGWIQIATPSPDQDPLSTPRGACIKLWLPGTSDV